MVDERVGQWVVGLAVLLAGWLVGWLVGLKAEQSAAEWVDNSVEQLVASMVGRWADTTVALWAGPSAYLLVDAKVPALAAQ